MTDPIPAETLRAFARTIHAEARKYGFGTIDMVRLLNELMDISADDDPPSKAVLRDGGSRGEILEVSSFPLKSQRLSIRLAEPDRDFEMLRNWMNDSYGKHFLMSCATAQRMDLEVLFANPQNQVGMILKEDAPIGAVAYLDIDGDQRRAELRKLIGVPDARGKGYAEEATRLWIRYGASELGLEKIYVSTLQTHLRNIRLNEAIGFRVEGVLHDEIRIGDERFDVLRMGLCLQKL